jgi:HEAT repeat protein
MHSSDTVQRKGKSRFLLAAISLAVLLATFLVVLSSREPRYGGRTISSWLQKVFDSKVFISSLTNQERGIRISAAYSLMRYGPEAKDAAPGLVDALNDSDAEVRKAARMALEKIAEAEATPAGTAHGQDH